MYLFVNKRYIEKKSGRNRIGTVSGPWAIVPSPSPSMRSFKKRGSSIGLIVRLARFSIQGLVGRLAGTLHGSAMNGTTPNLGESAVGVFAFLRGLRAVWRTLSGLWKRGAIECLQISQIRTVNRDAAG